MVHEVSVGYAGALEEGLVQSSCNIFSQASIDLTTLLLLVLLHSSLADDKILSAGLLSWLLCCLGMQGKGTTAEKTRDFSPNQS